MIFRSIEIVVTGLDPVIRLLRKKLSRRLMDARIKSGHDGRVSWGEAKGHITSIVKTASNDVQSRHRHSGFDASHRPGMTVSAPIPNMTSRSRGAMRPSCGFISRPIKGVGNAGCPLHPRPRVQL